MSKESANQDSKLSSQSAPKAQTSNKKAPKKVLSQVISYADIISETEKISPESPRAFEDYFKLFESLRKIKDLSNDQIAHYFEIIEGKLQHQWIPFLTKMAVSLCQSKHSNDSKFVYLILTTSKSILGKYGITDGTVTNAEKSLCLLKDGKFVTQFLIDAERNSGKTKPIAPQDLACLSFLSFSLFCRQNQQDTDYIQSQVLIDRAIAEYFSSSEHTKITEKDLAGKSLGRILSAKVFSPKNISELTYLYRGTTEQLAVQADRIHSLEEINQIRISKTNALMEELKASREHSKELQEQIEKLNQAKVELEEAYTASENRLDFEKNRYKNQFQSQGSLLAKKLAKTISLDLQAIRDLVEYLGEDDQRRFYRRLDRIDRYLEEFGGEQ